MKRIAILAALAFAVPAYAQQAPPSPEEVNALLQAVATQREAASNQAAQLQAKLVVTQAALDKAKQDAAACKPKPKDKQ